MARTGPAAMLITGVAVASAMLPRAALASRDPLIPVQCAMQGLSGAPTDVNAQAGDGRITVGLNAAGTITVFRYPNPSFENQVKYYASDRDANQNPTGALPNEGSFAGVRYTAGGTTSMAWLRDWPHTQRYLSAATPVPVTTYSAPGGLGLTVTDTDLATVSPADSFVRDFVVTRAPQSPVTAVDLVYYERFDPIASKVRYAPGQDNCLNQLNDQQSAAYDATHQAVVHSWSGIDATSGLPSSVGLAFGFDRPATSHQVGRDGHDTAAPPVGAADGYDQLTSPPHALGNADSETGQASGALTTRVDFDAHGRDAMRLIIGAGATAESALNVLDSERTRTFAQQSAAVDDDWTAWMQRAVLPATDDALIRDLAERALITIRLAIDPDTGAIVASADTQAPYGQDWVRDGSFINEALDLAGFSDLVTRHDLFEAAAQTSATNPDVLRPPGNWPMMVYGDGQPGGPIPYEIDETGLGAWTLWRHSQFLSASDARAYLSSVYPAISAAANWLTACKDPSNGWQCQANEDDSFTPSQTLHGAGPILLGLRSAVAAAAAVGDTSPVVQTWQARVAELQAAIDAGYDSRAGGYREQPGDASAAPVSYTDGGWLLWPVQLHPYSDSRMQAEARAVWASMQSSFASDSGGYEGKSLLGACRAWSPPTPAQHAALVRELHDFATLLPSSTGLFSEFWQRLPPGGPIRGINDAPHVWEHTLFYLAALCIDGPGAHTVSLASPPPPAANAAAASTLSAAPNTAASGASVAPFAAVGACTVAASMVGRRRRRHSARRRPHHPL